MVGGVSPIAICARTAAARTGAMGNGAARDRLQRDDSLPGLIGPTGGEGQIGLLLANPDRRNAALIDTAVEAPEKNPGSFSRMTPAGDALDFAASRNGCALPRRATGRQFRVRWDRYVHAAAEPLRIGKSWSTACDEKHRLSASSIFGTSTRGSMTDRWPAIWTRCFISRRRSRPTCRDQAAPRSGHGGAQLVGRDLQPTPSRLCSHRTDAGHFERAFHPSACRGDRPSR